MESTQATGIEPSDVVRTYQRVLFRDPIPEDVFTYAKHAPNLRWLENQLTQSVEFRTVVGPLRDLLVQEHREWLFREPSHSELTMAIKATRGGCGSDDAVRAAFADGSIRSRIAFRPLKIEMDVTNQCNLRCVMCHFSLDSFHRAPRAHISVERFSQLAHQAFHRAHQVSLSYGTEPLLHRDIDELIRQLARHRVPHKYLNTNGLLLRSSTVETMIEQHFDFLLVSVDAATAATYERIRVGASFETLLSRLHLLRETKAAHAVEHPRVGLGFVLMRHNLDELPEFIDFAARVGASSVNATHMVAWKTVGNRHLGADLEKDRCNKALEHARQRAAANGVEFVGPEPFGAESTRPTLVADVGKRAHAYGLSHVESGCCPFPWAFVGINERGQVQPCGWWDIDVGGEMGNIHEQDFLSIWQGAKFRELRARLTARRLEGCCAHCPAAGMGSADAASAFDEL